MKRLILLSSFIFFFSNTVFAQCAVEGYSELGHLQSYASVFPNDNRFFAEVVRIQDMFGVKAHIMYSQNDIINALAINDKSYNTDGVIVIYEGMLKFLEDKDYLLLVAILAHEYGHILQYKFGTQGYNLSSKQIELFADYLSGVYMQMRTIEMNINQGQNMARNVMSAMFETYSNFGLYLGDKENSFASIDPHGTPKQRRDALWGAVHDGIREVNYIEKNRRWFNGNIYYSIYSSGNWWRIGEYYYAVGLMTISNKF